MPGARSTTSEMRKLGWISAIWGTSRWLTISPCASTTIQQRSWSKPISVRVASCTITPAQDLTG